MVLNEMPQKFGSILSRNFCAMKYVSELRGSKRRKVINRAKTLRTEEEMRDYVKALADSLKC